ncbi:MAG: hypothetical protein WCS65_02065 [Verrucomicrobiae bacterium]
MMCRFPRFPALALAAVLVSGCAGHPPVVQVPPIPVGQSGTLLTSRQAPGGPAVALGQSWTKKPVQAEATRVHFAWSRKSLVVFAEMDDRQVGSLATRDNQKMWDLGDAFEVFLRAPGVREYVEIHVTPENHRLHLRYPPGGLQEIAMGRADFPQFFMKADEMRRIRSAAVRTKSGWNVALVIPADLVADRPIRAGMTWRFSVARYDGDRKKTPPVLTASSPYQELGFHRLNEWGTLKFTKNK